jgi:hypothetical protein
VQEAAEHRRPESAERKREDEIEPDGNRQRDAKRHHPAARIVWIGVVDTVHQVSDGDLQTGGWRVVKRTAMRRVLEQRPDQETGDVRQQDEAE